MIGKKDILIIIVGTIVLSAAIGFLWYSIWKTGFDVGYTNGYNTRSVDYYTAKEETAAMKEHMKRLITKYNATLPPCQPIDPNNKPDMCADVTNETAGIHGELYDCKYMPSWSCVELLEWWE